MSGNRPGSGSRQVVVPLFPERGGLSGGARSEHDESTRRPARIAHMLALAIRIEKMIASGESKDRAHPAANLGLSRARITQLLSLTLLAPDIQEELFFLEVDDGIERITERALRDVVRVSDWDGQRALWRQLLERVSVVRSLR